MPTSAPRVCARAGCRNVVAAGRYCEACATAVQQHAEEQRGSASRRGYGRRWRRESKAYLAEHPLCVRCLARKKMRAAKAVDHIIPHRGNLELFWRVDNWQPLCKTCHDQKTAREDGGYGRIGRPK